MSLGAKFTGEGFIFAKYLIDHPRTGLSAEEGAAGQHAESRLVITESGLDGIGPGVALIRAVAAMHDD